MSDDRKTKAQLVEELEKLKRKVARLEKSQATPKKPTERMRVDDELRIKDQAVACSINAIALSDLDGNLTYVNRSFLDMWGYEHEKEVLGKPAVYFMKAREKASDVQKASRTRGSWAGDLVATRKDGSTFVVQLSANLVSDDHGRPLCKMASFVDITERRRAEEELEKHRDHLEELVDERAVELKKSEEKLRVAIASLNANVFTQDKELRFTWVFNPAPGFKPEAILGKTDGDVLPPTEASPVIEIKKRVLETGVGERSEVQFTVGEARVFEVTVEPFRDISGDVVGIFGVSRDVNEIKRAEKALQESEARFRGVFESGMIGTLFWNADGDITDANDTFLQMVGYSRDEVLSGAVRWRDMTPPEYTEQDNKALEEVASTGVMTPVEKEYIRKDGSRIPIFLGAASLPGPILSGVAFVLDITDLRQAEEGRRESEAQLASFMESATDGFTLWNSNFDLVNINLAQMRIFPKGTKKEDIIRKNVLDVVPKIRESGRYDVYRKVMETGEPFTAEDLVPHPKFGNRHLAVKAFKAGAGLGIITSDVTRQRQAEGELRRHRDRLEELVESRTRELKVRNRIADIFLTRADDEVFAEVMQLFMEETGSKHAVFSYYDADRDAMVAPSMSRDVWEQCQVPDKDIVFPRETWGDVTWARAFLDKRTIVMNEPSTRTPEGHIPINRHIALPVLHHGESIGLMEVANKSTDYDEKDVKILETIAGIVSPILHARLQRDRQDKKRKLAEEKVRQANLELGVANQELESFAYSVSHDLRSPLRSIGSFSQILIDEYRDSLDDQGKDYLRRVVAAAERMSELIRDMLELSRVTRAEMKRERVDLSSVAREIEEELRRGYPERNAEIVVAGDLVAEGDPRLLRLALQNLLDNAWKFTGKRAKPRIEFGCTEREGDQAFYVRDDGVGFDMRYAEKLFAPFQRLHSVVEFPGTGVGLATVQRIIHRHGGRVWAEGKVDEGATFYFSL